MAGAKNHDFHILPPSPWPLLTSLAALWLAVGGLMYMKEAAHGGWVLLSGFAAVLFCMMSWWVEVVREAKAGDHTPVVQLHLRYGMILFIASEVMFFVGWFWAWFDYALFPVAMTVSDHGSVVDLAADAVAVFPAKGLEVLPAFELPLLNTFILLLSGTTVTWAHHGLIHNQRGGELKGLWGAIGVGENDVVKKGLWLTIILGLIFSGIQAYEYAHAPFVFGKTNYSSAFYMATGFHGFHVIVGTIFLMVCLLRAYQGDFTPRQHFGFEAAAWYWHFVDVVWLFLFVAVYVWGSAGAPVHGA
ncbi:MULTISPECIES: cytochrome c oxidase subunit 3 [unclassified Sphingomonas]|uniref:cytochrome c oxidase subunit 3 n=1 Tax=unclassified Sphingomonas TaxID=196159 RepID=UPI00215126FE|nr:MULTISPECIES: cytochrome c oxidase subunit 3 [unclassified Sphingomonas]MCR5870313.1 cytochrome c oxidase subunit 3 [Sphingomonas sp. J344]UUX98000.1 cytochrome c oxidase subunit 3 [Sphingomonas sp. J315]